MAYKKYKHKINKISLLLLPKTTRTLRREEHPVVQRAFGSTGNNFEECMANLLPLKQRRKLTELTSAESSGPVTSNRGKVGHWLLAVHTQ